MFALKESVGHRAFPRRSLAHQPPDRRRSTAGGSWQQLASERHGDEFAGADDSASAALVPRGGYGCPPRRASAASHRTLKSAPRSQSRAAV
eukprot:6996699-Pyramimonas_sp.AAC.1